uniref:Kinesin-like protein KIF2A-like N-terminal domain-containing protein n=1 Tax=Anopheles maculatus TaxID=74869 RepID=A0A182SWL5_9DIPT
MLWFKKRLSTLFGGGKRSTKRVEGQGSLAADDSGRATPTDSASSASAVPATGCSTGAPAITTDTITPAVNIPEAASKAPPKIKTKNSQQKKSVPCTAVRCDNCAGGNQCRIHTAIVSRFHEATRSVTVEWYERGESKGKEIEIDTLLELNEKLQHRPSQLDAVQEESPDKQKTPAPANLARNKGEDIGVRDNIQQTSK